MPPREKILQRGIDSLSNTELVSAIISTGTKGVSYKEVAKSILQLLKKSKNSEVTMHDISKINGVGVAKGIRLIAGIELGNRLYSQKGSEGVQIVNSEQAAELFEDISWRKKEYVKALYLNARFELLKEEIITIGSHNIANISARDLIIPALELNAFGFVLGHNHPSGDPTPSSEDMNLTNRIREGCDLVDVKLLDHLVVSQGGWRSVSI